jgi:hypothetical protein
MDTPKSPECAIFEDPLLRDVVALAMSALVSAGDLLSLTTLELTACIHDIPHDFSAAWQKSMTTSSIAHFIFACARGYNLDPSSLLKFADEITISAISFTENYSELKNRAYLEHVLHHILDTVQPSGPLEPDKAELAHDEEHGLGPRIPDMEFESEAYYQWEEDMLDEDLRRSWEEEADEARERKELKREIKMKNRWKIIMEKAIDFAAVRPTTDFNFERCRSQSC